MARIYPAITNSYSEKFIEYIRNHPVSAEPWVALNKIHGTNLSFHVTENGIKPAAKKRFIGDNEKFYNYRRVLDRYRGEVTDIFNFCKTRYGCSEVVLFTELFGGSYPHPEVPKIKEVDRIQKGVFYYNDIDIYLFDIKIDGIMVSHTVVEDIAKRFGIFYAEALYTGSFEELLH